jgi:hypothetical protein
MTREAIEQTGGDYYADGRRVYKSPIHRTYSDGTSGSSMGFLVCECNEYVDGAAEYVAKALNGWETRTGGVHSVDTNEVSS